ncbi:MAG: glycosylase [Actinobacteria bacterium]|nr:glycosylase [Actinomycetota bacterium]
MTPELADAGVEVCADPARVILRLFLPGEATPGSPSRTQGVLERLLALPPGELSAIAADVRERYGTRHPYLEDDLRRHARTIRPDLDFPPDDNLGIALGAVFSAEVAPEGACVCNPSVVAHPDQSALLAGQLRVVVSLRLIGEGHRSSIGFCEAVIGPGRTWVFAERAAPLHLARIDEGLWDRAHLLRALEHRGSTDELARTVLQALPEQFGSGAIERAVQNLSPDLLHHAQARGEQEAIRVVAGSAYRATFSRASALSQRVLVPVADEEAHGIEDLRLVRFGAGEYRGTYTAYDGHSIATRLLVTADFRSFAVHRLTGRCAGTKGLALFPRPVGAAHLALARSDGETLALTTSADGLDWSEEVPLHYKRRSWEIVQSGTCGPPMETEAGWLVITHGVGAMRAYGLGALLLDLEDPTKVLGSLDGPLLPPDDASMGYVPNVVYSCGSILHDDIVWIPYAVADQRTRVASVPLSELMARLLSPQVRQHEREEVLDG